MTCSPVCCWKVSTHGSDWLESFNPLTSIGMSPGLTGSNATRTIGAAYYRDEKVAIFRLDENIRFDSLLPDL